MHCERAGAFRAVTVFVASSHAQVSIANAVHGPVPMVKSPFVHKKVLAGKLSFDTLINNYLDITN